MTTAGDPQAGMEPSESQHYWPGSEWRRSTPEAQGLDPVRLLEMVRFVGQQAKNINSILIIRDGYLVMDAYFGPHGADTMHDIASATKSITSMLVGIAIKHGHLEGTGQRIVEFFPELQAAFADPRKRAITLAHLLSMTSGLGWNEANLPYSDRRNTFSQMTRSQDWARFVVGRPMQWQPGARFTYNSGGSHLLSAIVQRQTGSSLADFAAQYLFEPLGISRYYWPSDRHGITRGSSGLQLTAPDMGRLGYLYLHNGFWDGAEVVPADYVAASTVPSVDVAPRGALSDARRLVYRLVGRAMAPRLLYGYGWWIPSFGGYSARGYAGQAIFVIPRLRMVVVMTGGLPDADVFLPEALVRNYILAAARPTEPCPAPVQEFAAALRELTTAAPVFARPAGIAQAVSGQVYAIKPNRSGVTSVSLSFEQEDEALLTLSYASHTDEIRVGLDNLFRENRFSDQTVVSVRGAWVDETSFAVESHSLTTGDIFSMLLVFEGDRMTISSKGMLSGQTARLRGYR